MREKLDDKEKQFVDWYRGMGNKLSLKQQLEKIFLQLDFWKTEPSKYGKYIDDIVEIRNRISHATKNISPQTNRDVDNITHNLTNFISSLILFEIKYND